MAAPMSKLSVLRGIIRELQYIHNSYQVKNVGIYGYIMEQFRKYQVTGEQVCRGRHEMEHLARTYHCLLESVRKHEELTVMYKGKGERTPEEAAAMVGLKLPIAPDSKPN